MALVYEVSPSQSPLRHHPAHVNIQGSKSAEMDSETPTAADTSAEMSVASEPATASHCARCAGGAREGSIILGGGGGGGKGEKKKKKKKSGAQKEKKKKREKEND